MLTTLFVSMGGIIASVVFYLFNGEDNTDDVMMIEYETPMGRVKKKIRLDTPKKQIPERSQYKLWDGREIIFDDSDY